MKLTLLQENLIKALVSASHIITTKAQMPILGHIKIEAKSLGLLISATDLEIGLKIQVKAKVEKTGALTVPARVITELVNNCGPGQLILEAKDQKLSLSGSGTKATISGMSATEYPELPSFIPETALEFSSKEFIKAIQKVAFSAAVEDSRPVLTAIQLKTTEDGLEFSATDGFRLSWLKFTTQKKVSQVENKQWLIPARALQEIVRLSDSVGEQIKFSLTDKNNQVVFQLDDTYVVSRLISGDFPNIHKVMPETGDTIVELDRNELLRAMKLASIFARESANIVKFKIDSSAGQGDVTISANAPQVGEQQTKVDAKITGPSAQIAFNYRYVLDFINNTDSRNIKFLMTNSLGPGLWLETDGKPKKENSRNQTMQYKHVIMPVRVESGT